MKEDTEVQDNTELGREFQRATVDGRKDCNLRCVLHRGIASVSLCKDCLAHTEARVGSCARRAGGPWPCISFHSQAQANLPSLPRPTFLLSCISLSQRSGQVLSGLRTRLVRITLTCSQSDRCFLQMSVQHSPWSPVSIGKPAPKIHQ